MLTPCGLCPNLEKLDAQTTPRYFYDSQGGEHFDRIPALPDCPLNAPWTSGHLARGNVHLTQGTGSRAGGLESCGPGDGAVQEGPRMLESGDRRRPPLSVTTALGPQYHSADL